MKSSEIRQAFIDYFAKHKHQIVASSSLVPANDPTLLFTNAGMVQFKDVFLGQEKRPYTRAVSAQRCVRAGGKHNDLENVGYTARHHTFFEMLGNFSFGDYFKREAIQYAWEFLTQILKLAPERLWITVFRDDDEAAHIWLDEIGVDPTRFSRCGEDDNFWSMGDTGPCGPCSEIFYDHGSDIAGGPPGSPEADGDRYIEIWNLVFMQFNRDTQGHLHPLPKPSVDTGMGLERITAVVQGVHSNYHIDSFQYLIRAIAQMVNHVDLEHPSLKVIADHIRACAFLMSDGVLPGNEGRGYVLRRIIRRAIRHGHKLGLPIPFFYHLLTPLIVVMGDAYPELIDQKEQIERILIQEEKQFARTIDQGLRLLQEEIRRLKTDKIPGEVAFRLYDTYGFPLDLTADIAREQGLSVDIDVFNHCMQQQRKLSQSASQFHVDYSETPQLDVSSTFHGYAENHLQSSVVAILQDGQPVKSLSTGAKAAIILQDTPFYAESGGQVGDQGYLLGQNIEFRVEDTQSEGQAILHYGELLKGEILLHQSLTAEINIPRREAIRLNHTATHLLHAALKKCIGPHVQQRGSLVDAARARFDFSHFSALTQDEIERIESLVNEQIRANHVVETVLMQLEEAANSGAVALFGEKYADVVRVLSLGDFSKELCGGTHARRTGDIGLFKIAAEYGVASGVRRIDFLTGEHALNWVNQRFEILDKIALHLKTQPATALEKLMQTLRSMKQQEKEIAQLQQRLAAQSGQDLVADVQKVGQYNVLIKCFDQLGTQELRDRLDQVKSRLDQAIIVLFSIQDHKLNIVAGVSKSIVGQVPGAVSLIRHICGKGGGRDDMAQGGGPVPDDLDARIEQVIQLIAEANAS